VAVFRGIGWDQPGVLRPLVAVANTHGDDLRIIDAVSNKVITAPTLVAALTVPTEPRPSLIAAGSLHDTAVDGTPVAMADLLVVAPRGQVARPLPAPAGTFGSLIQSVVTWAAETRVAETVDLGDLLPDATLTALLVVPVPVLDATGLAWRPTAGTAKVVACTSDGALVSIRATRLASGAIQLEAPPVAQLLGFTCLDLAISSDGTRLYAATLDPIPGAGGLLGVAEFDNTVLNGDLPVRALSAGLGTTQVAVLEVAPFIDNDPNHVELDLFGPSVPRVYASLDPGACGVDRSMPCGIAAIDPVAGGLAPDPAGELPYQLPVRLPGDVVDIAVSGPPARTDTGREGLLKLDSGTGVRFVNGFAAVATSSGRIYLVDLPHFSVGNQLQALSPSGGTRVISSQGAIPGADSAEIGIWSRPLTGAPVVQFDLQATGGIVVTPGYTDSEIFTIAYQGSLPGLEARRALAHVSSGPPSWIAVQEATGLTGSGTSPWRDVARLYDPRLAVQVGDLVQVTAFPAGSCSLGAFELVVTALLPPDPLLYPGGAVSVAPVAVPPASGDPACLPQGADSPVTVTFRVPNLVLTGNVTGYAGRPEVVATAPETAAPFEFKYQDERLLACPIMQDDPGAWPPAAADLAACEADPTSCRATCEKLVLARRARRIFYMTDGCGPTTTTSGQACTDRWVTSMGLQFPLPRGPALAFKVGITDPTKRLVLKRGAALSFTTLSGMSPYNRTPSVGVTGTGVTAPHGLVLFDRSVATGLPNDAIHGYAAFADNLVLDFAPWSSVNPAVTIR
jgi:hypothetical protein